MNTTITFAINEIAEKIVKTVAACIFGFLAACCLGNFLTFWAHIGFGVLDSLLNLWTAVPMIIFKGCIVLATVLGVLGTLSSVATEISLRSGVAIVIGIVASYICFGRFVPELHVSMFASGSWGGIIGMSLLYMWAAMLLGFAGLLAFSEVAK